jgi:hypothetical protein
VTDKVIEFLGKKLSEEERQDNVFCDVISYLIGSLYRQDRDLYEQLLQPYQEAAKSTYLPAKQAGERVVNACERCQHQYQDIKKTIERIELLQKFTINT